MTFIDMASGSVNVNVNVNATTKTNEEDEGTNDEDDRCVGFLLGHAVAHVIFLNLPEPWLAVPHAEYTLRPNGWLGLYSPCVEQTQRTCAAFR